MADIVTAIVEVLKADAGIAALTEGRIFGGELPADEAADMPRRAVVIQPSGGPAFARAGKLGVDTQRLDAVSYGATPNDASELRKAVYPVLRRVERLAIAGTLIHWVQSAGGYMAGRDRDGQWPYAFQSFQSLFATDEVA